MRLGSLVLGVTYRHPAVLASWAATVDHASGGRLVQVLDVETENLGGTGG